MGPKLGRLTRKRRHLFGAALAIITATAIAVLALATTRAPSNIATTSAAGVTRYDGTTLLKGVFFGVGPAATQYPDLVVTRVSPTSENTTLIDQTIAAADKTQPGFTDQFATAMYSGDRVKISSVSTSTAGLLQRTLADIDPPGSGSGGDGGAKGDCLAVAAVLAVVSVVAAVLVEVKFWIVKPVYSNSKTATGLTGDQWVDKVATTLDSA